MQLSTVQFGKGSCFSLVQLQQDFGPIEYPKRIQVALHIAVKVGSKSDFSSVNLALVANYK